MRQPMTLRILFVGIWTEVAGLGAGGGDGAAGVAVVRTEMTVAAP